MDHDSIDLLKVSFEKLIIETREKIKEQAKKNSNKKNFGEMLTIMRSYEKKVQELRTKNELLEASMEDRNSIKKKHILILESLQQ